MIHNRLSKLDASCFQCFNLSLCPSFEQRSARKEKRAPMKHINHDNTNNAQSWRFFFGECPLSEMSNALYTASAKAYAVTGSDSSARNPYSVRQTMSYTPLVSDIPRRSHNLSLMSILSSVVNKSPCVRIKIGFSSASKMEPINLRYFAC